MPYHITSEAGKFEVVDDAGKIIGTHPTRKQALAQLKALYANVPDAKKEATKDPGDYLIVEDSEAPTTWHLQVKKNGTPDHVLMGAAWAALHDGYRGNKYEGPDKGNALDKLKKLYEAEKMDTPATKETQEPEPTKPSVIDRVLALFAGNKEGRRNSSPDGDRLQQIHDLAVLNGASCPMVMKEADGRLRWVLFSSNAFQDSDREIVSQKALEADVARTDKESAPYGPLRWWHMGAPDPIGLSAGSGADIGDCDYRAMSGRVLIESGTFRSEQIGAAVKERADTLAGSIGFFHPRDEPDNEGVYQNIVEFERSLLPRGKASNSLTALTVKGDQDMATSKEKQDALAALLGDPALAESIIKQAEATEKAADDRGLKYKEEKPAEPTPETPAPEVTAKALSGEPTAVPAHGSSGLMKAFGLDDDDDKEAITEKMYKAFAPRFEKMIEEKMKAGAKETAEKEAGLKATIDQIAADVKELKGDVPRGLQGGFRASLSDMTILKEINTKSAPEVGTLDSVIDQLMGIKK
jgi:hypothetical protein